MQAKRAVSVIGIILGSSLVAVAVAGELTQCQTRVQREGLNDLTYWSWRTIDGAGLADITEPFGELQQSNFGADDLRHGVLQCAEAGRFAPRPLRAPPD